MIKNKNYDFKIKRICGNTTILVLIISFAIIMAMTTLVGYMFRDIIFTKFDEGKFKALNIAEAGLADMYSTIEKYYNEEITSLPSSGSGYPKDVADSDGVVQGSFYVTYDRIYNDDGEVTNYIINSVGTDAVSGETREVRVNLGVSFSTEVNIFDYIYSKGSITFDDLTIIEGNPFFNGPTYIRGNVTLRLLEGRYFSGGGKILIGGNLDMGEWADLDAGPVNVGGNVEMSGRAYLEHDFEEYMIVMKDIRMTGNSQIGENSGNPINLCCEGVIDVEGGSHLYYNPPLGEEIFDPPNFDSSVYVNNFMIDIQEPPTDVLVIDEDDMTGDDFVIDISLLPVEPPYEFLRTDGDNSIKFWYDEVNGSYYLEVQGNVLVNGNIIIGEDIEDLNLDPPDNDIYYSGKGKLIATGNIDASCGLVPTNVGDFPEDSLLILMTPGNLDISINNDSSCYNNFFGDYEDPDLYILGMAGGTVTFSRHTAVLGSILAGQIDADDLSGLLGWLIGSFSTIGYQDGLSDSIPEDMPMLYYGGATFTKEWQETID